MLTLSGESAEMRIRQFDLAVTFVCLATLGYFAWHAQEGPRGFPYFDRLSIEASRLDFQSAELDARRKSLEHRVSLLRPDSIDPDMLDEMVRSQLELVGENDLVVFVPN